MDTTTAECYTTQLIEGDGTFNGDELDDFIEQVKLAECGHSYVIVSIMGPQSSGKSTLLNHLFHANFKEMNVDMGRTQTTQGIWIARCVGIEPCTIVMDIEGTDGQERGEDDTVFEKQSALFAMAVSDIVILNMWCHDIGREHAANKPLLKTVFEVMLRLFSPRKITLMFVIRDKTKTPLEVLESSLRNDIQKMWDSVPKPEANKFSHLSEFFYVEVVALSNYEYKEEEFKEQVATLRQKFIQSTAPGGLASDRRGVIPASGLSLSAKEIWKLVKGNEDLKLPTHMIMVATIRCEEIAREKHSSFATNQDWFELKEDVQSRIVPGFGMQLDSLLDICLSSYDEEVTHYDGTVASEKRQHLYETLMQLIQPTHKLMFRRIRSEVVDTFKTALRGALNEGEAGFAAIARERTRESMRQFDELCRDATSVQANFDTSQKRDKVSQDLSSHIINLQAARLSELRIQLADKRIHVGPWGGNGGDPWEFIPDGRITHIHIRCGKVIDAISFNYIDSQGNNHQSSNFGGSEGALTEVRFAYDEEIINIKGRVGGFGYFGTHTVITSLTFVTNRATYGPYGNHNGAGFFIPEGIDFSLPLSKGRIIGFYGKSSIYLENFGVVLSS